MVPIANLSCPDVAGTPSSYTGLWYRGQDGLGGASVVVNAQNQAQIHYLFDADGQPRWLLAAADSAAPTLDLLQFSGFCAVCSPVEPAGPVVAGTLDRSFSGETTGNWTLDYAFAAPLAGTVRRTDPIYKLTHRTVCE
jgi:hypothetical protein